MRKQMLFLGLGMFWLASLAGAQLKLPALISDHMVLQKGKPSIWGWADPSAAVTVALGNNAQTTTADDQGRWKVSLAVPKSGGPYSLTVSSGSESVTVQDILIGEVWLGSGQSNMEFSMKTSNDADIEIPKANFQKIRLFTVERVASFTPLDDVKGSWKVCAPDTVADFSAVAYHFGKEIHKALKVPVGLIVAAWGGSGAEAWTPRAPLEKDPVFTQLLDEWDHNDKQNKTWKDGDDFELWVSDIRLIPKDPKDKPLAVMIQPGGQGLGETWTASAKPGCQASVSVTGQSDSGHGPALRFWGVMKGGGYGGTSANLSNQPVDLSPYQAVEFYLKGKGQYRLTLGQASIADYDYYATKDPFDAPATWTKMRIEIPDLKQGGWGAPRPFTVNAVQSLNFPVQVAYWPDIVSASYNAMIAPVTNFSIAGVLWYQGEANTGRAAQYQPLLSHLITSWREDWGRKFPFLIIQLPNFMATQANPSESQWAELREAQRLTSQAVPQTGLITTIDLGDANTIHPKNKTDVGKRVALAGLGMAYHRSAVYSGPTFFKAQVKAGKMILIFNNLGRGLKSKDNEPLKGFALAGIDHIFHWANAEIKGKTVVVWSDQIPAPTKVRYAWADNPVCNLYNLDGLPASPFQFSFPEKPGPKTEMDDIPPPP